MTEFETRLIDLLEAIADHFGVPLTPLEDRPDVPPQDTPDNDTITLEEALILKHRAPAGDSVLIDEVARTVKYYAMGPFGAALRWEKHLVG